MFADMARFTLHILIALLAIAFWVSLFTGQWIAALLAACVSELLEKVYGESHV